MKGRKKGKCPGEGGREGGKVCSVSKERRESREGKVCSEGEKGGVKVCW